MKEHPILMSTHMVQATLEGRKTMTRRVIKPQPIDNREIDGNFFEGNHKGYAKVDGHPNWQKQFVHEFSKKQVGDLLWVRETFVTGFDASDGSPAIAYKADCPEHTRQFEKWKPSIFMPKSLARLWLEILDIKVEQLQAISEADAIKEGIEPEPTGDNVFKNYLRGKREASSHYYYIPAVESFRSLWQSINDPDSWKANPWVWAIKFKRIER